MKINKHVQFYCFLIDNIQGFDGRVSFFHQYEFFVFNSVLRANILSQTIAYCMHALQKHDKDKTACTRS